MWRLWENVEDKRDGPNNQYGSTGNNIRSKAIHYEKIYSLRRRNEQRIGHIIIISARF